MDACLPLIKAWKQKRCQKRSIHLLFFYFLLLETASNTSKSTKKQDMFAKWTRVSLQHQFNKNWLDRQKMGFFRDTYDRTSYISKNPSKSIPSPEENYFVHFALRYPVILDLAVKILRWMQNMKLTKNLTNVPIVKTFLEQTLNWLNIYKTLVKQ